MVNMNPQISVSVIIPTYKPKDYLWECLDSISKQTLSKEKFEVLLILNGCCEPYKSDIDKYIAQKMQGVNIKLIHTDQSGVSNARNIGLDQACGEYITFIDDDDYVSPGFLETLLTKAATQTVVFSDGLSFEDGESTYDENYYIHKAFKANCNRSKPFLVQVRSLLNSPCMKLFHKDIIGQRRFNVKFSVGEDSLMMVQISDAIKKISFASSPEAIYYRRVRPMSATTQSRSAKERIFNSLQSMKEITTIIIRNPFSYNLPFVLSRYMAVLKTLIERPLKNLKQKLSK